MGRLLRGVYPLAIDTDHFSSPPTMRRFRTFRAPLFIFNKTHFASFKLMGIKSNRYAMGARLKLTAAGSTQIRKIAGGGSYLSQSDLRVHFGLGSATNIDKLSIN